MTLPRKVYLIYNTVTCKGYVGSSGNIKNRIRSHFSSLRNGNHPVDEMQTDFDEYGNHFVVKILDTILNISESHKEHDWMRKLKTYDKRYGYNYKDNVVVLGRPLRSVKHFYEYKGKLFSIGELSLMTDIPYEHLMGRLRNGWSVERAMTQPIKEYDLWWKK